MATSYNAIAAIANDPLLRLRLIACAADEEKPDSPEYWVSERIWKIAASPDWGAAWNSALALDIPNIGKSETVISDGMILAVIQPMT